MISIIMILTITIIITMNTTFTAMVMISIVMIHYSAKTEQKGGKKEKGKRATGVSPGQKNPGLSSTPFANLIQTPHPQTKKKKKLSLLQSPFPKGIPNLECALAGEPLTATA